MAQMRIKDKTPANETDTRIYRGLQWLNEHGHQNRVTLFLWRWRAAVEDRTQLKQEARQLRKALQDIMPGPEAALVPVASLNAVRDRAERAEHERDELAAEQRTAVNDLAAEATLVASLRRRVRELERRYVDE
jgi:hypothetical protein